MSIAHVPKFGDWEDKDIPYTTYFENARKDKVGSFNPNDPEDNPEGFMPKHPLQQQHSREKQSKSSSMKANIDPPRISVKINLHTDKSNSNTTVSHQPHNDSLSSKHVINAVSSTSIDFNDKGFVHQKPTYTAILNEVKEKKQNVPADTTIPKNRKAMQRTSSKKWCCLLTKSRE